MLTPARVDWAALGPADVPDISEFITRVWGRAYGPAGHPRFDPDYLQWIYRSRGSADAVLIGGRAAGRLVAFRALVPRTLSFHGQVLTAHISTHLTVDPDLSEDERRVLRGYLMLPHSFIDFDGLCRGSQVALSVAFHERDKQPRIARLTKDWPAQYGLVRTSLEFRQAILSPAGHRRAYLEAVDERRSTRPSTPADAAILLRLFERVAARHPLALVMDTDQIHAHLFGRPQHRVFLALDHDEPAGFVSCYPIETIKSGAPATVLVVEFLIVGGSPAAALLLNEAVSYGASCGARGVVIENPTAVDPAMLRACGVVPSPRQMVLTVTSRLQSSVGESALVDVK